jgi:hypothetical protein
MYLFRRPSVPATPADTRRTRIRRALGGFTCPCIQTRGLGTTIPRQAPRHHSRNGIIAFLCHAIEDLLAATSTIADRMASGRGILCGLSGWHSDSHWRRRGRRTSESQETRTERCQSRCGRQDSVTAISGVVLQMSEPWSRSAAGTFEAKIHARWMEQWQ